MIFTSTKIYIYHLWDKSYKKPIWSLKNKKLKNEFNKCS